MVNNMKTQIYHAVLFVSSLLVPAGAAQAQFLHSSTAAEGYLHGSADLLRAQGEYNLLTSQAAINQQQAYSRMLDNRQVRFETYWNLRRLNESQRAERRRPPATPEQMARWNQSRLPKRLSLSELNPATGAIHWVGVLEDEEFASGRTELARLFADRDSDNSGVGSQNYRDIQRTVAELRRQLQRSAKRLPADEFIQAKKFVDGLAYEARFARNEQVDEVAAN